MTEHLIDRIRDLSKEEIQFLLEHYTTEDAAYAKAKARKTTDDIFGRNVYIRGLIEISNICKNNCYYCGIRSANANVIRYRLEKPQILSCCREGYRLGFRTFVLQGGEDPFYTDAVLTEIVQTIKQEFPDCAVTLSLGERSDDSYARLRAAGADRYLLRHETAAAPHYAMLHPASMSFQNRMHCLHVLKSTGWQTGCGMMVGSPYQTAETLAEDLIFLRSFRPQMVGIGPFIPARHTPFEKEPAGSTALTLFLISLIRLMLPYALIPATTALQTLRADGRICGLDAGANVIMPNLSPAKLRGQYALYDNKANARIDTAQELEKIGDQLAQAGYTILTDRGDYREDAGKI